MRAIPDFVIAGVGKAGTTSIYHYLNQHPGIYLPPIKETNHFALPYMNHEHIRPEVKSAWTIDVKQYINSGMGREIHGAFVEQREDYLELFEPAGPGQKTGEICPNYFYVPDTFKDILKANPDVKIIVILRNPYERAFSSFRMHIAEGKERNITFEQALKKDQKAEISGWGITRNYIRGGLYADSIERLQKVFHPDSILFLLYDDLRKDQIAVLAEIFDFIDVSNEFSVDTMKKYNAASEARFGGLNRLLVKAGIRDWVRKNMGSRVKRILKSMMFSSGSSGKKRIPQEAKQYMQSFFENDISRVEKLINKDLSHWKLNPGK